MSDIGQNIGVLPFFSGVVEDRFDPLDLGRVRVRIFGIHSDKLVESDDTGEGIPVDRLPLAYILQPTTSASISGIGVSPTGIVEGTHVFGVARDGELFNDLIIIGTLGGIPQSEVNVNVGFNDPNGLYPRYIGESDVNRLARNESISDTIVQVKKDNRELNIQKANGTGTWNEPVVPYAAKYPYNHVRETESGHIEEFDDTSGAERIHRYHMSGTFEEIHPSGDKVTKIVGSDYELVLADKNLLVKGNVNITVLGDCSLKVVGDVEEQVDGSVNRHVKQNLTETIDGDVNRTVKGNVTETVEGSETSSITGDSTKTASNIYLN